jgi:hypothetical protein
LLQLRIGDWQVVRIVLSRLGAGLVFRSRLGFRNRLDCFLGGSRSGGLISIHGGKIPSSFAFFSSDHIGEKRMATYKYYKYIHTPAAQQQPPRTAPRRTPKQQPEGQLCNIY